MRAAQDQIDREPRDHHFTAALGIAVGLVLGVAAAMVRFIAEPIEPVMSVLNAIPRVVLAPLFVIWLGIGLASKIALSFILVAGAGLLHGVQRNPAGRP